MAEHAVVSAVHGWSADLPHGQCICTRLDDGSIHVDQADPRVLISGELLDAILLRSPIVDGTEALAVNAWLNMAGYTGHGYVGAVLHIDGVNQQVVYRIVDMVPRVNGYVGEWPD
jgi:hypothetical protein